MPAPSRTRPGADRGAEIRWMATTTSLRPPPPCRNGYCARFYEALGFNGVFLRHPAQALDDPPPAPTLNRAPTPSRWPIQPAQPSKRSVPPAVPAILFLSCGLREGGGQCVTSPPSMGGRCVAPPWHWGFSPTCVPCSIHASASEGPRLGGGQAALPWPAPGPTAPLPAAFMVPGSPEANS